MGLGIGEIERIRDYFLISYWIVGINVTPLREKGKLEGKAHCATLSSSRIQRSLKFSLPVALCVISEFR